MFVKFLGHTFGIQRLLDVFEIHLHEGILQWLECSFFLLEKCSISNFLNLFCDW